MKILISLDISSSTIGWAVFEYNSTTATLKTHGHFKPPTKKQSNDCMPYRLQKSIDFCNKLLLDFKPNEIAIEDYAKKFTKGKSTANTIITLSTFNEVIRLTAYQNLKKDVYKYPVSTIRGELSKFFNEKIVSKDDIFPVIQDHCKNFIVKYNKNGNVLEQSYDEADAIACGILALIKNESGIKIWNL